VAAVGVAAAVAVVTIATAAVPRADERPYLDASSPPERATTSSSLTPATPRSSMERPPPAATTATTPPKATPAAPASPSKRPKNVELRWRPVRTADYYNVILWSDGTRLRDYWPRRPLIVLVPRELARLGAADASAVHWFVYPVTVEAGRSLVGSVHANGTFTLPPRAGPTR
jgi:hypothetical protein